MVKRAIALLSALVLALTALTGCAPAEDGLTTVRLSEVTHSVFYAPMYAAINLGFFEDEGIAIELSNSGGADIAMAALLSGEADVAFMGPEASVYVVIAGSEAPVVMGRLTQRDGSFLVGREPVENFDWSSLAGSYIVGGRQGGMPEMTLEYALRKNGIEPHLGAEIDMSISFNNMAGAFTGGLGDYVTLFEPTASQVQAQGQGYILASVGEAAGDVPYTCYQATRGYLEKNEELMTAFMRAIYRGMLWVDEHSDAEVAEAISASFSDTGADSLTAAVASYRAMEAWAETPLVDESDYERILDVMQQAGQLTARPAFDEVFDLTVSEKAIEDVQK